MEGGVGSSRTETEGEQKKERRTTADSWDKASLGTVVGKTCPQLLPGTRAPSDKLSNRSKGSSRLALASATGVAWPGRGELGL